MRVSKFFVFFLALLTVSALVAGCDGKKTAESEPYGESAPKETAGVQGGPKENTPAMVAPPGPHSAGAPPMAGGPMTGGPMMGGPFSGGVDPMAPLTPTPELDKKITELAKGKDKKALAAAYAERGDKRMTDPKAGTKVKYRAALTDFRAALKADGTNELAKTDKEQIEMVYASLGRPVPGEETAAAPVDPASVPKK